ncbi:hypothetical protein GIB67_010338 [Kingdonia uniflora]|uniref:AAA+ ATPase domain-containing protein n=1 Tax=Kingdonia uniflora TaxID=39325 RepID=A0A7J7MAF8_9MAGN|nr:hypothetical protein GIB67_010338 [Kingdonia uniflora]
MARPIFAKLIPCNLGTPQAKARKPLKHRGLRSLSALGSLGKSRRNYWRYIFNDFAGQEYIKRELQEIVRILKNEEEFQNKGIYCPKGVMLQGPPGTGKALLSKAIAGKAGLPFYVASGTDFVEMFGGVRVKDLFTSARSFAPSIIFIDEIDAIGCKRGRPDAGGITGGAEKEQGLLQILTEMDGFKVSTSQVLVISVTNRLDILDPALLRKGHFDKIIRVRLPSKVERFAILEEGRGTMKGLEKSPPTGLARLPLNTLQQPSTRYFDYFTYITSFLKILTRGRGVTHSRPPRKWMLGISSSRRSRKRYEEKVELAVDFIGAELQNVLNEAGILTARKDLDYIGREELLEALKRKDIHSVRSKPNMQYAKISGRIFSKKSDYVQSIVRECARNQMHAHESDWTTETVPLYLSSTLRSIRIGVFQGNER